MVFKNGLQDIHKTIMKEKQPKENPHPSRLREGTEKPTALNFKL